ncbi:MAG: RNA polymerase sigma factor [Bryobacteraceae bacterium]
MQRTDSLVLPAAAWRTGYLEDVSPRRLVLEHYDREQAPLRRYLHHLGLDADAAQEVVQESFLKLHQHLLAGGDRTNLRAWLYRVAHNVARNLQTAFRARNLEAIPEDRERGALSWSGASAEEDLLARERVAGLRRALEELSAAQRECLVLRAQGFKYREIAEVLNVSASTVGENIQRGLARLKERL